MCFKSQNIALLKKYLLNLVIIPAFTMYFSIFVTCIIRPGEFSFNFYNWLIAVLTFVCFSNRKIQDFMCIIYTTLLLILYNHTNIITSRPLIQAQKNPTGKASKKKKEKTKKQQQQQKTLLKRLRDCIVKIIENILDSMYVF